MPSNFNEVAYGGIADSYANKYGIPTNVFRDVIRMSSNFDPFYTGTKGDGIAAIKLDSSNQNINPFDIGQSMDIVGKYMVDAYQSSKSWESAAGTFLYGESAPQGNNATPDNVMPKDGSAIPEADKASSKSLWQYSADDWKALWIRSAWTILFTLIGILIIAASLYVLVTKGGDKVVAAASKKW